MRIEAVIFDMDGLMLDSEQVYAATSRQTIREMGYEPSEELILRTMGLSNTAWSQAVGEFYGEEFDTPFFLRRGSELMAQWEEEKGIPIKPGLIELLEYLGEKGIPCAVASSTYEAKAMKTLRRSGVDGYFAAFVFGDMVEHGKPAPDIFLAAAAKLGRKPTRCMGLEDSGNGLRACRGAGLYTVMVPDMVPPTPEILSVTDGCVRSLLDIIPLLDRLNGSPEQGGVSL